MKNDNKNLYGRKISKEEKDLSIEESQEIYNELEELHNRLIKEDFQNYVKEVYGIKEII